ncbi:hypothetical protein, partial [Serratia marcescens]|uniref:hypothetical protein n=1 Tax=Serratia marcescens TaxID=615 RepID=UPI00281486FF
VEQKSTLKEEDNPPSPPKAKAKSPSCKNQKSENQEEDISSKEKESAANVILELSHPQPGSTVLLKPISPVVQVPIQSSPKNSSSAQESLLETSSAFRSFVTSTLMEVKERLAALEKRQAVLPVPQEDIIQLKNVISKLEHSNRDEMRQM